MQRIKFLDGLRGWGAVFVLLYHVLCSGLSISDFARQYLWRFIPFNGPFAVFVFFIVSGFALTIGHLRHSNSRQLAGIAATRYFRLALPIFFACAVVHLAQISGLLQAPEQRWGPFAIVATFPPSVAHLLHFSFFEVFFNYSVATSYIGPLWTMHIELFGSFVAMAVAWVVGWKKVRMPIIILVGCIFLFYGSVNFLFVFGLAMAHLHVGRRLDSVHPAISISALVCSVFYLLFNSWSSGRADMVAACAFVYGCVSLLNVREFLSTRFSAHLGEISFPLYLMHGSVMLIVGAPLMQSFGNDLRSKIEIQVAVICLSILAAYAFLPLNNLITKRLRRWAKLFAISRSPAELPMISSEKATGQNFRPL